MSITLVNCHLLTLYIFAENVAKLMWNIENDTTLKAVMFLWERLYLKAKIDYDKNNRCYGYVYVAKELFN